MKNIIITIMKKGKTEAETIATIPFGNIGIIELLIPKDALTILQQEGMKLNDIINASKKDDLIGTLLEIQKPDKTISLAIVKEALSNKGK